MYRKYLPWYLDTRYHDIVLKGQVNASLLEETMTLLNWNVHKNNHHYTWLQDFEAILQRYEPNLIAFQEYQTMGGRSIIDKNSDFSYGFFPNIAFKKHRYGLLSAGTSTIHDAYARFSHDVEPLIKTPKVSFVTRLGMLGGESLTLINVHMINFVKIKKYIAQMKQVEQLCEESSGALILTGDFNTWSLKRMRILQSMVEDMGLKVVPFEVSTKQRRFLKYPLDHVFYRGLSVDESLLLSDVNSSDHAPMVVRFSSLAN